MQLQAQDPALLQAGTPRIALACQPTEPFALLDLNCIKLDFFLLIPRKFFLIQFQALSHKSRERLVSFAVGGLPWAR